MSSDKKLVPKRRFKEFKDADAWEQRKLGEIAESYSGGTPSVGVKEYYGGTIPFIRSAEINSNKTELFITQKGLENSSARIVNIGDILYALYGATSGEVGRAMLKGAVNQAVLVIQPHNEYSPEFLMQWLRKSKQSIIDTYLQGGQGNLSGTMVKSLTIDCPIIKEQEAIGTFFCNLDNLITLHQRKLSKLRDLKAAMLSEMFPQNRQNVPIRRFTGFTDAWEQRKFSQVFLGLQNTTYSRAELNYENGFVRNVHYGDVLINFGEYLDVSKVALPFISDDQLTAKYKTSYLQDGDIIITDTAEDETVGKCTEIANVGPQIIVSGLHTIPCRPSQEFATAYLGYYMNSSSYHDQLLPLMQGIKVSSISKSALQNTDVSYPKNIDEQQQIGTFFRNLDNLITLHQRKLEKLENIKKAYLNEMFV